LKVNLQVSSQSYSDACSISHHFCLARNVLWIADSLEWNSVDEGMVVSEGIVVSAWSVKSMSYNGSGKEGISMRAVKWIYYANIQGSSSVRKLSVETTVAVDIIAHLCENSAK